MDAFYRGPVAKAIARTVEEAGGWLSLDDLAAVPSRVARARAHHVSRA
jgi:gamma-glutamyltranspeptidase